MDPKSIPDGGPAFPASEDHGLNSGMPGMSLRDHYAGLAMAAFDQGATGMGGLDRSEVRSQFLKLAEFAYLQADAMIEARGA